MKTLCASMFIVSVVQHIKIGDLSIQQGGVPLAGTPAEEMMEIDGHNEEYLPSGTGETAIASRDEERALARDSTAGFAGKFVSQLCGQIYLHINVSRLARLSLQANFCSVRKFARGRRKEEYHRW